MPKINRLDQENLIIGSFFFNYYASIFWIFREHSLISKFLFRKANPIGNKSDNNQASINIPTKKIKLKSRKLNSTKELLQLAKENDGLMKMSSAVQRDITTIQFNIETKENDWMD